MDVWMHVCFGFFFKYSLTAMQIMRVEQKTQQNMSSRRELQKKPVGVWGVR